MFGGEFGWTIYNATFRYSQPVYGLDIWFYIFFIPESEQSDAADDLVMDVSTQMDALELSSPGMVLLIDNEYGPA